MIEVSVTKLGQRTAHLTVQDGDSVQVTMSNAGIEAAPKSEIRVNGTPATAETPLHANDKVTVVPPVRGGSI